jgi:CHAT domain/NACHT domain
MNDNAVDHTPTLMPRSILIEALKETTDSWELKITSEGDDVSHVQNASLNKKILEIGPSASDLQWYFRDRIQMPFLETARAVEIERRLELYGTSICEAIFPPGSALQRQLANWIEDQDVASEIRVVGPLDFQKIQWELLRPSTNLDPVALRIGIIRSSQNDRSAQIPNLSSNSSLKILLVTSRTRGTRDIDHRIISLVMDEIVNREGRSCSMNILPRGTLEALKAELETKGFGFYHIVHFDTHGLVLSAEAYEKLLESSDCNCSEKTAIPPGQSEAFVELQGKLRYSFGIRRTTKDLVPAATLANILDAAGVKISILNSCDSASTSSSLISAFHEHGVRHVIGMSFALSEEAAKMMTRVLYDDLISGKPLSTAITHARKVLFRDKSRSAFFGASIELEDWLLPIVYSSSNFVFNTYPTTIPKTVGSAEIAEALDVAVQNASSRSRPDSPSNRFHQKYRPFLDSRTLLGRDFEILQMQQLLLEERNALLLRGLGGIGKSFLLQHLCLWWTRVGFCDDSLYYEFSSKIWSLEQLVADMGSHMFVKDLEFQTKPVQEQIKLIHQVCHDIRLLIVLDNLEAISQARTLEDAWEKPKQRAFRRFLAGFSGSKSLLLLGSRSAEKWLSAEVFEDNILMLGGLDREATSLLIRKLLDFHNRPDYINLDSLQTLSSVADYLNRHPLAMQAVISSIQGSTPRQILETVQTNKLCLNVEDDLNKCLRSSFQNLSEAIRRKILQLAPFSAHVVLENLCQYSKHLAALSIGIKSTGGIGESDADWQMVIKELQNRGLAASVMEDSSFYILHPHLIGYVLGELKANKPTGFSLDDCKTALMLSTRDIASTFLLDVEVTSPRSADSKLGRCIGFSLENYRRALFSEVTLMNKGKSNDALNIWHLISAFFDSQLRSRDSLEFSQTLLRQIDRRSGQSLTLCSQVLNNICQLYQDLKDEKSALETLKEQLMLLSSFPIKLTINQAGDANEKRVQIVDATEKNLAQEKSQCYEQLSKIAVSNIKLRVGIDSLVVSVAWQQATAVNLPERAIWCFNLLSKLYSLSENENISRVFRYAALMRALTREDYPALVWGTVLNQDLEKFSDEELPFVERILGAVNSAQGKKMALGDRPSIDMYLLETAMRQGDSQKVLRSASAVISRLKQMEWDPREFELFRKLADWYENRGNISEARDCWLKGYQSVASKEDLTRVIDQKSALGNLIRLEAKLGNQALVIMYESALNRIRVEVVSPTEVVWSMNKVQVCGAAKLLEDNSILSQAKNKSNDDFWQEIAACVDTDLHLLKPTVDQFFNDAIEDAKLFSDIAKDRKAFLMQLAEELN